MAVVTISRQLGSGGDWLARKLSEETGYLLIDRPKLMFLLREKLRHPGRVRLLEERQPTFLEHLARTRDSVDELVDLALKELATRHDLVVVGRGGQGLYGQTVPALHVRVVAPLPVRIERLAHDQQITVEEARERIGRSDRERAEFLRYRHGIDVDDPSLYHVVVNTGRVRLDVALQLLLTLVRSLQRDAGLQSEALTGMAVGSTIVPAPSIVSEAVLPGAARQAAASLPGEEGGGTDDGRARAIRTAMAAATARAAEGMPMPPVLPWPHKATYDSRGEPVFAHPSEAQFARVLDFYRVRWEYEPVTFPLEWAEDGRVLEAFTPDFYLPDIDLFVELTTMKQSLVTRKNRKVRQLRELYPQINIKVFYSRDYRMLLRKLGAQVQAEQPEARSE